MILKLSKIIEEVKDHAFALGFSENELVSFIIVAKFQTELSNDVLSKALKIIFMKMNSAAVETLADIVNISSQASFTPYELIDALSDILRGCNDKVRQDILDIFDGNEDCIFVIKECFGNNTT